MADEITVDITFKYEKNGVAITRTKSFNADVAGDSFVHGIQEVGLTEEAIVELTDVGDPGWCFLRNTDATNFIDIGGTGSLNTVLLAGESCVMRLGAALYAQADTAACDLEYLIVEL